MSIPVTARVSSADAKESFDAPISRRTAWLTSSRVVAFTTHAAYCLGSFFEATMIVFAACVPLAVRPGVGVVGIDRLPLVGHAQAAEHLDDPALDVLHRLLPGRKVP